jgi:cell wall-associated NlpC family hydrolase
MARRFRFRRASGQQSGRVGLTRVRAAAVRLVPRRRAPYGVRVGTTTLRRYHRKLPAVRGAIRELRTRNPGLAGPTVRILARGVEVFSAHEVATAWRTLVVSWAKRCVAHASTIHYDQRRPFPLYAVGDFTMTLDCSGFCITMYRWAGGPRITGTKDGYGFSGSIAEFCKEISRTSALPGDLVVFGRPRTTHVQMLIERGTSADPLCISHGSESGPYAIRLSSSIGVHSGQTVRFFRAP